MYVAISTTVGAMILGRLAFYRLKRKLATVVLDQLANHQLNKTISKVVQIIAPSLTIYQLKSVLDHLPLTNQGRVAITLCLCNQMVTSGSIARHVIISLLENYLPITHTTMLMWFLCGITTAPNELDSLVALTHLSQISTDLRPQNKIEIKEQ
nr:ORF45 [Acipenserid herpesvirus 1]